MIPFAACTAAEISNAFQWTGQLRTASLSAVLNCVFTYLFTLVGLLFLNCDKFNACHLYTE